MSDPTSHPGLPPPPPLVLLLRAGKPLQESWDLPTSNFVTAAPRAVAPDDDPLGIRAEEAAMRLALPSLGRGGRRRTYDVEDVLEGSYVVVRAPDDKEDHFAFCVDGVPLWLAKVLRVDDDNASWCVRFLRGKGIGQEIRSKDPRGLNAPFPASRLTKTTKLDGVFEEVVYRNITDGTLSADRGSLVVVFDSLLSSGKMSAQTVKEIVRVVRAAATVRSGHDGRCASCKDPLEGDAVPECGCCARQFHRGCLGEAGSAGEESTWWCSECQALVPAA